MTLILAALAAGAVSGAGETAGQVVKDGYAGLKALIVKKFADHPKAEATLAEHQGDPDVYEKPLAKYLVETGADQDQEILAAAESLVRAADQAGVRTKYAVMVSGGKVGIIGDHGTVTMN